MNYCDTDLVIYIQPRDGSELIETGDKLVDMTSQLRRSETISEFVSGGPKNYAFRVLDTVTGMVEITVCKFGGITLNYNTSRLVNFEVIRDRILGTGEEPTVVNIHTEKKIKCKRKGGGGTVSIVTEPEEKQYRISIFKRRRLDNNTTVPFVYK